MCLIKFIDLLLLSAVYVFYRVPLQPQIAYSCVVCNVRDQEAAKAPSGDVYSLLVRQRHVTSKAKRNNAKHRRQWYFYNDTG